MLYSEIIEFKIDKISNKAKHITFMQKIIISSKLKKKMFELLIISILGSKKHSNMI